MARPQQMVGAILDGPLAVDTAVSAEAATIEIAIAAIYSFAEIRGEGTRKAPAFELSA